MKPPNASKETLEAFWGLAELDKKTRLESSLTILKDVNNHQSTQTQVGQSTYEIFVPPSWPPGQIY